MQVLPEGTRRHSPKDLIAYLEGDFAAWCERFAAERTRLSPEIAGAAGDLQEDDDPERELLARMGREHEARYLADLRMQGEGIAEIQRGDDAAANTLAAMRDGAPVIYQPCLDEGLWFGYPDFLVQTGGKSALGSYHYVPWDTKLARSARPYFLIQLCAYADYLKVVQGVRPAELVFVLGDRSIRRFLTEEFFHYYRLLSPAHPLVSGVPGRVAARCGARPGARSDPRPLESGCRSPSGRSRPPEPGGQHHPEPGPPARGSRGHHVPRAGRARPGGRSRSTIRSPTRTGRSGMCSSTALTRRCWSRPSSAIWCGIGWPGWRLEAETDAAEAGGRLCRIW